MMSTRTFTFGRKVMATIAATAIAFVTATMPTEEATAASCSPASYASGQDYAAYIDTVNTSKLSNEFETPKDFVGLYPDAILGDSASEYDFDFMIGDIHYDLTPAKVKTGGYAIDGASIEVEAPDWELNVVRSDDTIIFIDSSGIIEVPIKDNDWRTEPFVLAEGTDNLMTSADMAMIQVVIVSTIEYESMMTNSTKQAVEAEKVDGSPIEEIYNNLDEEFFADIFVENRKGANYGIQNCGWKEFADIDHYWESNFEFDDWNGSSITANSADGSKVVRMQAQEMTELGFGQGYVALSDPEGKTIIRFSFNENGDIVVALKRGGVYEEEKEISVSDPKNYGFVKKNGLDYSGYVIDTELLSLANTVMAMS